jgi:hypothetical protein
VGQELLRGVEHFLTSNSLLTQVRSGSEAVRLTAHGLGSAPSLRSKIAKTLERFVYLRRLPALAVEDRRGCGLLFMV